MSKTNTINNDNIGAFIKLYNEALNDGCDVFIFEGAEVLVAYAKYVIEYFENASKSN